MPFIWNYKTVRISKKHLQDGFSFPNFKCIIGVHTSILAWWKKGLPYNADSCPTWVRTERLLCKKTSLPALLNSPTTVKKSYFSSNFVFGNTIKILKQIKLYIKAPKIYTDTPVCKNHSFIPGLNNDVFSTWKQRGICNISDLYIDGKFVSFAPIFFFSDFYKLEIMLGYICPTLKF